MKKTKTVIKVERSEAKSVDVLPDDIASQVGHVISRWSRLEGLLQWTLFNLAGVNDTIGRLIVGTGRAMDQIRKIEDLLTVWHIESDSPPIQAIRKELANIKNAIEKLEIRRDTIAHGRWILVPPKDELHILEFGGRWNVGANQPTVRRRGFPEPRPITAESLKALVGEIDSVITPLKRICLLSKAAIDSWRSKHPSQAAPDHQGQAENRSTPEDQPPPSQG